MPDNFLTRNDKQGPKRREIRVLPEAEHSIRIDLMGRDFIEVITAVDISLTGVKIDVFHGFKGYNLKDRIDMLVLLPTPVPHSITTTAKVVHIQNNFFGVEFVSLEKKDFKKLHEYIAYLLKNEGAKPRLLHALQRIIG
jgi:c-di-GMP-binding flagellar brake protein YcgR